MSRSITEREIHLAQAQALLKERSETPEEGRDSVPTDQQAAALLTYIGEVPKKTGDIEKDIKYAAGYIDRVAAIRESFPVFHYIDEKSRNDDEHYNAVSLLKILGQYGENVMEYYAAEFAKNNHANLPREEVSTHGTADLSQAGKAAKAMYIADFISSLWSHNSRLIDALTAPRNPNNLQLQSSSDFSEPSSNQRESKTVQFSENNQDEEAEHYAGEFKEEEVGNLQSSPDSYASSLSYTASQIFSAVSSLLSSGSDALNDIARRVDQALGIPSPASLFGAEAAKVGKVATPKYVNEKGLTSKGKEVIEPALVTLNSNFQDKADPAIKAKLREIVTKTLELNPMSRKIFEYFLRIEEVKGERLNIVSYEKFMGQEVYSEAHNYASNRTVINSDGRSVVKQLPTIFFPQKNILAGNAILMRYYEENLQHELMHALSNRMRIDEGLTIVKKIGTDKVLKFIDSVKDGSVLNQIPEDKREEFKDYLMKKIFNDWSGSAKKENLEKVYGKIKKGSVLDGGVEVNGVGYEARVMKITKSGNVILFPNRVEDALVAETDNFQLNCKRLYKISGDHTQHEILQEEYIAKVAGLFGPYFGYLEIGKKVGKIVDNLTTDLVHNSERDSGRSRNEL